MTRTCPHCGAPTSVPRGTPHATCAHCGRPFEVLVLASSNPAPPSSREFIDVTWQFHYPFVMALVGMICLAIAASVVLMFINQRAARDARERFAHRRTNVAPAIPPPTTPRRAQVWYEPEAPGAARVGPELRPGLVGLFAQETGRVGRLYLGGFDAERGAPVWSAGPLGLTAESTLFVHAAVAGTRVVASDARPALRIFSAATGAPIDAFPLPSRATRLCPGPVGEVWIELATGGGWLLPADAVRAKPAERPSWCPALDAAASPECRALLQRVQPSARCDAAASAPSTNDFTPAWVLRAGPLAVAVGRDATGPALLGTPRGATMWRASLPGEALPPLVDLVDDRVLVKCESRRPPYHPHLLAFDARSGARLWDTELPREEHQPPPRLSAGSGRVFVATEGQLQLLDAATGAIVGTIGD